jgi:quinol monooxygenase YgiN
MIVRIFDTAVDPADVERTKDLFRKETQPAFEKFEGCHGIEMLIGVEEHSGDLVDIVAISRWDSLQSIESAIASVDYDRALAELRKLFQQTPIVRHFQTID